MNQKDTTAIEKTKSDSKDNSKSLNNKHKKIEETIIGIEPEYEEVIELYKTYGGN